MTGLGDELAKLEATDPAVAAASTNLDATIQAIGSQSFPVRRVGSSVIHATRTRFELEPAERFGRAVRVLRASKVEAACGVILESSQDRPVVVMRPVCRVTCRACRHVVT